MVTSKRKKVWLVLNHPMQLAIARAITSYWRQKGFIFNLLISSHAYWEKVDINLYKHQFDKIIYFEDFYYTWHPLRILRIILRIWHLKRRIARLGIRQKDVIIGLSVFSYLENIVLSTYRKNLKIAMMPSVVYQECIRKMDKSLYRNTPEGLVTNWLIEPITGLHRTYCMKDRLHPDMYWRIRYRKSLPYIYDKVAVMDGLPKNKLGDNIITMPYPYILALERKRIDASLPTRQPRKVIFFGDFFGRGLFGLVPEIYARHLNLCLSFLRENYASTHHLVYRPHPAERDEVRFLDLDQFEIEKDGMLAELYFYENAEDVHAVFSVASTSSRSAFHFFLNSYVFLNVFPFDEGAKNYFKFEMGNVPAEFYINDLATTPRRYVETRNIDTAVRKCQDVLDGILPN